jgi:hypothetical protein
MPAPHITNIIGALAKNDVFNGDLVESWLARVEDAKAEKLRLEMEQHVKCIKDKAAEGDPAATTVLGMMYYYGSCGQEHDPEFALKLWKDVADNQSYPPAQYHYGMSLVEYDVGSEERETVDRTTTGLIQIAAAAGAGCETACYGLATFYRYGSPTGILRANRQQAVLWYNRMEWCQAKARPDWDGLWTCSEKERLRARRYVANDPLRLRRDTMN